MKISVIYPNYNCCDLTVRALNSIEKRKDIEIIIIDDCSDDGSYEKVLEWSELNKDYYGNIVVLRNEERKGSGYSFNRVINDATGEYIIILNNDDFFMMPLSYFYKYLDGTDMIYYNLFGNLEIYELNEETKSIRVGATKFIRREFIGETRKEEIMYYSDLKFYKQLQEKQPTEIFTNEILYYYNYPREGSLMNIANKNKIRYDGDD